MASDPSDFFADYSRRDAEGRLLVLQVMTARSEANGRGEPVGLNFMRDRLTGATEMTEAFWLRLLEHERTIVPRLAEETRQSWRKSYVRLLAQVRVPVILFHFSTKPADEDVNYAATTRDEFYGSFPQFVDMPAIQHVAGMCDGYVECRSGRGLPHPLVSRLTGAPVEVDFTAIHASMGAEVHATNAYYPSSEMHEDAAAALAPAVSAIVGR